MARTLKLTVAYDGTAYAGWQRQARKATIQQVLEEALASIVHERVTITAAGRTDAGVHAAGQVASFTTARAIRPANLVRALNTRLPADIRVCTAEEMAAGFDARRQAVSKTYRYAIWNGGEPGPFFHHVVWHVPFALDAEKMQAAARLLEGEHDFAAFQGRRSRVKTTVRRILKSEIVEVDLDDGQPVPMVSAAPPPGCAGRLLRYEVTGTGFLRHMVRAIAGTLVEIGRGRRPVEAIKTTIASRDRRRAGMNAPPHGLMLWKVYYKVESSRVES
jgi:tRNA pseudouridine38-40 synthase